MVGLKHNYEIARAAHNSNAAPLSPIIQTPTDLDVYLVDGGHPWIEDDICPPL